MDINDNKAGMQGLDKERINATIRDATGEKYAKHQQRRQLQTEQRIRALKERLDSLTAPQIQNADKQMDQLAEELERDRDLTRTIVHVDMDAFFAAVEMRDNAELRHVPMAVGSDYMLSTSNYAARKFGVRAAMPGFIARKLCPQLVFAPCDHAKYAAVADEVRDELRRFDAHFSAMSLDEAYLDITDLLVGRRAANAGSRVRRVRYDGECECRLPRVCPADVEGVGESCLEECCVLCGQRRVVLTDELHFGDDAREVTRELRARIEQRTGLTASAGIAPNAMLAKICTDINKPNGQFYLPPQRETVLQFVHDLPLRKVCGIGTVTETILKSLNITTGNELFERRGTLALLFSEKASRHFLHIGLGIGSTRLTSEHDRRSISVERTFQDVSDSDQLTAICRRLCEKLAKDVERHGVRGRTVTLKLKLVTFETRQRSVSDSRYLSQLADLHTRADQLLRAETSAAKPAVLRLRLMGVRLSNLESDEVPVGGGIDRFLEAAGQDEQAASSAATGDSSSESDGEAAVAQNEWLGDGFDCPVCAHRLPRVRSVADANRHVDECLNVATVKRLQEENKSDAAATSVRSKRTAAHTHSAAPSAKSKLIDSYFKRDSRQ